ncbi:MAG TPA: proton-conducting transporter membrane subunit [Solirubrobacterales bacterium]|jgi:multicomponent Na+:H+ antiporter subunit D|nr:proton-conducting transporter membrane subunit [Solirubrobacterales bacterium]
MVGSTTIAALPVAVPLIAAAVLAGTDFLRRRWLTDTIAIATAAGVTVLCAILLARAADGPIVYWLGEWQPRHGVALGISLTIDTLGAGMATLVALLVTATLIFSARYFDAVSNLFHSLLLVFCAAMVGFCLSGDLFNMFVFFELMSGAAYALTAYQIEERGPLQGAINFAVSNSVGAIAILSGIALIYGRTGALNLAQIGTVLSTHPPDALVAVGFALIVLGFLTKAAAFPVHFWLADAHAVAPTPVCVLFSGVMVELGLYAIARVYWTAFAGALDPQAAALRPILIWIGVVTALVGALMCVQQRHLKRLLAFSTVSHVGLFLICLGLLTHVGVAALASYVLAHAFAKAALFMCVGILIHRFADVDELRLRGCGRADRALRLVGVLFVAGAVALTGAPFIGVFVGKSLGEGGVQESGFAWAIAVFILASGLTAGAILRAAGTIFAGWGEDEPPQSEQPQEADVESETLQSHDRTPLTMLAPAVALTIAALVASVVPGLDHAIQEAAGRFTDEPAYTTAVLYGRDTFTAIEPESLKPLDFLWGSLALAVAVALAGVSLFGAAVFEALPSGLRGAGDRVQGVLRSIHSGHVGDYIAWLTAGAGVLAALVALAVT